MISAVRGAIAGDRVAENVVVYSWKRIQTMTARNLGDVLSYVPGVDVGVGSRLGQATALSIHGSNSRDVLVMVDDIPFNSQLSGQANLSRIPIENIQRVEIIKGASSSAWGSSLGGVVNVITKDTGDTAVPKGSVTSSIGGFKTRKNSLELAGKVAAVGYYVSDSLMTTRGVHAPSSVRETKSFNKLSVPLGDEAKLTGSFGYSGGQVEERVLSNNRRYNTPYISRYGKMGLDLGKPDLDLKLAYKYNDQDTGGDTYNATTGARLSTSVSHDTYHGLSLNGRAAMREDDVLVAGVDFDRHTIKSSNYLSTAKSVNTQAPYANYTWRVDHLDLIPGLRYDNNDRFGNQLSPSLGTVYHFTDDGVSQWRAKVSRAFNAPPLMWIFNDDPVFLVAPNLDLKAERAFVYETGVTAGLGRLRAEVNLYRSDVEDGLAMVFNSALGAYQIQNIGKVRRQGVEAQLDYKVTDSLKTYISGGINHPVNRVTRQVVRDNGATLQSVGWGLNYQDSRGFGADLYGHFDRWDSTPGQAEDRKPILDLKLSRAWKSVYRHLDLEVFLDIYNLTNSKYWSNPIKPLTGRNFEGGATISF
jgi:vitamin B12 transporter